MRVMSSPFSYWVGNIEHKTEKNKHFRHVIYTAPHMQLVLYCLEPGQEIGMETHDHGDQFIRVESGFGCFDLDHKKHRVSPGFATIIPQKVAHNVINTSTQESMHIYVIYTPPEHNPHTKTKHKKDAKHHD